MKQPKNYWFGKICCTILQYLDKTLHKIYFFFHDKGTTCHMIVGWNM